MKPRVAGTTKLRESLVTFAEQARREGLLSLEASVEGVSDPFVKRGLQMIIDGLEPDTVEEALDLEIEAMQRRHAKWASIFTAMGGYAPTMGIIGTVMGLVGVLSKLSEPEKLGESIATAFIATLIGILTANVLWLPMASNLKQQSEAEVAERKMAMVGIMAIQAGENPRIVAQKLASMADPEKASKGAAAAAAPAPARVATEEPA
jgi:chemotaxis protein MotA